jgi:serine/threonine protein kinase
MQTRPTTDFLDVVRMSGIFQTPSLDERLAELPNLPTDPVRLAAVLVERGLLTRFQAKLLLAGKFKGFRLGQYVIRDKLGSGGMGTVFLAEHDTLCRSVALKVLNPTAMGDAKLNVERFLREARAAAALDHPNIVRIHDVAQQGNVRYLVMEYVDGVTLDALLTSNGPLPPSRAVAYIAQAAAGLQQAHEKGFVHRDIKPANLILAKDGVVKILDMGLARSASNDNDRLTDRLDKGAVFGTLDYVSPEQALCSPEVDIRSDVYSLGVTFFTLVRGHTPFEGNATQKLAQLVSREPPDLASLDATFPPKLAAIVAKMLAKKPKDRYQTPAELIAALAPWLSQDESVKVAVGLNGTDPVTTGKLQNQITQRAAGHTKKIKTKKSKRHQPNSRAAHGKLFWIGVAALVVVVGLGIGYALKGRRVTETASANPKPGPGTVVQPQPKPNPPTTQPQQWTPPSGQAIPSAVLGATSRVDFASIQPDTEMVRGRKCFDKSLGKQTLPSGWEINHYSDTAEAEYLIANVGEVRALGLHSITGAPGTQVLCYIDSIVGRAPVGARVTLQVTYQSEGANQGGIGIQLHTSPYPRIVEVPLEPTNGTWKTAEVAFTQPENGPHVLIINTGKKAGGTLWLKSVSGRVEAAPE